MDDEPKTAAENEGDPAQQKARPGRRRHQGDGRYRCADIAIRKRTANLRAIRLAKEAADRAKPVEAKADLRKRNRPDMTKDDRDRAEARFNKAAKSAEDAKTGKKDRDASAKAVLDNMARLRALRLAKEAAEPAQPAAAAKKPRGKSAKKSGRKTPALSDWLSSQQSGGRRT